MAKLYKDILVLCFHLFYFVAKLIINFGLSCCEDLILLFIRRLNFIFFVLKQILITWNSISTRWYYWRFVNYWLYLSLIGTIMLMLRYHAADLRSILFPLILAQALYILLKLFNRFGYVVLNNQVVYGREHLSLVI